MTKNEFKDGLLKKIEDCIETENAENTNLKHHYINMELWCSVSLCEDYIIEASCIKHKIMKIVSDYFSDNAIETDNSPYKEMWEELKSNVGNYKSRWGKLEEDYSIAKFYHSAMECQVKKLEEDAVLREMKIIEQKRGIKEERIDECIRKSHANVQGEKQ